MTKNYTLVPSELDHVWESFIEKSPDATIFLNAKYLKNAGCRIGLYRCYNAKELRAVVGIVESPDGSMAILDDLIVYSGICFAPASYDQSPAQQISERFDISSYIAAQLSNKYSRVEFALSPTIMDIRPFLWHNYGEVSGLYNIDIRYTSFLDISDFGSALSLDNIAAYKLATGARRQQIRYARRDGVVTKPIDDIFLFIDFYRQTLARQGVVIENAKSDRIFNLVSSLINNNLAMMFGSFTAEGKLGSVAVFAYDLRRAYYLFGASDPALRSTPTGTAVLWDAFSVLSNQGLCEVDLEGVNSPKRGWFKLSFGGKLQSYYHVSN